MVGRRARQYQLCALFGKRWRVRGAERPSLLCPRDAASAAWHWPDLAQRGRFFGGRLRQDAFPAEATGEIEEQMKEQAPGMPSPVVLKIRPRCWSISGSINSPRWLLRTASVFSSSAPISREYSTTSAQRIA